jgi:L-fuculose-phosphate aldolase
VYKDNPKNRNQIVRAGRASYRLGLNSLKSGNISLLLRSNNILITKTGRSLRNLNPRKDLTVILDSQTDRGEASCEFEVHRAIYQLSNCASGAILHCHSPYTVAAAAIARREIPPAYNEAKDVLGDSVIVNSRDAESLGEDPRAIGQALSLNRIVAVRGHGTFALAETLEQCLYLTQLLETSCHVLFLKAGVRGTDSWFNQESTDAPAVLQVDSGLLANRNSHAIFIANGVAPHPQSACNLLVRHF